MRHFSFFILFYTVLIILFEILIHSHNAKNISEQKNNDIEQLYIDYILSPGIRNPVCLLEKSKKISLCFKIFSHTQYADYNIYVNEIAFFTSTAKCERKPVHFKQKTFFLEEVVIQEMYPCYGRHKPIRTNYKTDDNYDKFYISNGITDDSIFVYMREFHSHFHHYIVHNHTNVDLRKLSDTFVTVKEINDILKLNQEIILTNKLEEIELIYIREKENPEEEDKVVELSKEKKAAVCSLVLDWFMRYQTTYNNLTIVEEGFNLFSQNSSKNKLKIHSLNNYKNILISQRMFPCFSTVEVNNDVNIFRTKFFSNFIFVSEGSRPNSVFVYLQIAINKEDTKNLVTYTLSSFIENIFFDDLTPVITNNQTNDLDSSSVTFIHSVLTLIGAKEEFIKLQLLLEHDYLFRILKVKKNLESSKTSLSNKKLSLINPIIDKIGNDIFTIIHRTIQSKKNRDNAKRRKHFILDEVALLNENKIIAKKVNQLIGIIKRDDLKEILQKLETLLKRYEQVTD